MFPVMQAYGSLALEDSLEVDEAVLGRCRISCDCTSAFKFPDKEADPHFAMRPSGRRSSDFPYLQSGGRRFSFVEGPFAKGPRILIGGFSAIP